MLIEIQCDRFRQKSIRFHKGLNVVLGDENATNSIGKSTLLMVVDFVLGGDSLLGHNNDVVSELKDHDYRFAFEFEGEKHYFSRGTSNHSIVNLCNEKYEPIEERTIEEFRALLMAGYQISLSDITFRSLISPYFRVWGKGNAEDAYHPLHVNRAQSPKDCVNNLVKTFNLYYKIKELHISLDSKEKDSNILRAATNSNLLPKIGKREREKNNTRVEELERQLNDIKSNLAIYATNISEIINRDMVEQKSERDALLELRSKLQSSLLRVQRNIKNNRHIKSTQFDGVKQFFPEVNQERLASVEEFHSEVARLLKAELRESEHSLSERISQIDEKIAEIDSIIAGALKTVKEPTAVLDMVVNLSNSIQQAEQQNRFYDLNIALKESIATLKETLSEEKSRALASIEKEINDGMRATVDAIFGLDRKSPELTLKESNYTFQVFEDTGTGAAFVALIVFDLTIFSDTQVPAIAHDSIIFKNIENDSVSKLIPAYTKIDKQSFIAIDEIEKYGAEASQLLRKQSVIQLSDGALLYDTDWRAKDKQTEAKTL